MTDGGVTKDWSELKTGVDVNTNIFVSLWSAVYSFFQL
jgi:hypothetical protein